jgi:hypothetical protein
MKTPFVQGVFHLINSPPANPAVSQMYHFLYQGVGTLTSAAFIAVTFT